VGCTVESWQSYFEILLFWGNPSGVLATLPNFSLFQFLASEHDWGKKKDTKMPDEKTNISGSVQLSLFPASGSFPSLLLEITLAHGVPALAPCLQSPPEPAGGWRPPTPSVDCFPCCLQSLTFTYFTHNSFFLFEVSECKNLCFHWLSVLFFFFLNCNL
jgi:hypothetical protein